ncbi:endonuclease MutS2 [Streptococcus sp. NLN64]|uniref:endonuclease MutS2 n=1 Tax=Streptococcus sp. NLN64 TaxID=2822799 RepID=UPI0018CAA453|nr:endonuclease MutS2 [Streptococcus sp. NLN64]MBG9367525.1 endonuclease MutS2 [Streptococcus sp. NLN64]
MNNKIYESLEFPEVKSAFAPYLRTVEGQKTLANLEPMTDVKEIQRAFDQLGDMQELGRAGQTMPITNLGDLTPTLKRLQLEAELNLDDFQDIKTLLRASQLLKEFYLDLEDVRLPNLAVYFENLEIFPQFQGALQAIADNGTIEDFASEDLMRIRRRLKQADRELRQTMQELLKKKADYLADPLFASRNGRNVLPVKQSFRNRVQGIVQDISATGSTVYIEPRELIQINEGIASLEAEERYEIRRILRELANLLRPQVQALQNNHWLLGHFDFLAAKYQYMRDRQAHIPNISTQNDIRLLQLRHPLLEQPVANDLHFGKDLTSIVMTGPNTGGKTLMLKTLGLAQLMGQAGLPILAAEGSQIGLFDEVFADIGDEQSIEQSLSTFSSHMTNIIQILQQAGPFSLVLFDELGAGTDPQEGAALAISILEDLRLRGIKTMATTHYPELKAYGIETDAVENASMEFDTVSLRPTYRFMQGVPGRSNAFEIARRLGLAEVIVTQAEGQMDQDQDVSRIIQRLEEQTLESRKRLEGIRELEQENHKLNRALKKLYAELERGQEAELNAARQEAQVIVAKATEESDQILKNLQAGAQLKPHQVIEAKAKLKELAPATVDLSKNRVLNRAKKKKAPKVGMEILVSQYGQRGNLVRQLKDGRWEAQVGLMKMTLKEDEFEAVQKEASPDKPKSKKVSTVKRTKSQGAKARLDLRGKRYEEAMEELDAFIDQALLNNLAQVDIIHGIGTGVIREGVQNYLRRNKQVKSFAYAPQNAGGSGATIAIFK